MKTQVRNHEVRREVNQPSTKKADIQRMKPKINDERSRTIASQHDNLLTYCRQQQCQQSRWPTIPNDNWTLDNYRQCKNYIPQKQRLQINRQVKGDRK